MTSKRTNNLSKHNLPWNAHIYKGRQSNKGSRWYACDVS